MNKLTALAKLTRIEHSFMLAVAVLIAEIISRKTIPIPALYTYVLFSLIPPFFISLGSFALNDYLDLKSDRINKRTDRPLVTGGLPPQAAFIIAALSFAIGLISAFLLPAPTQLPFYIALGYSLLAIAYDFKLKDLPLIGNLYIATTMAIPFIYGAFIFTSELSPLILSLAAVAFLAGLGREIVKSIEDMEGDRKARKSNTLPILIGAKPAAMIASLVYFIFIPLAFSPFYLGLSLSPIPFGIVAVADCAFLYLALKLLQSPAKEEFRLFRKLSLAALGLGLLGYLSALLL